MFIEYNPPLFHTHAARMHMKWPLSIFQKQNVREWMRKGFCINYIRIYCCDAFVIHRCLLSSEPLFAHQLQKRRHTTHQNVDRWQFTAFFRRSRMPKCVIESIANQLFLLWLAGCITLIMIYSSMLFYTTMRIFFWVGGH